MSTARMARGPDGRWAVGEGREYALPPGYEARVGPDGARRVYAPSGRPAGPYAGRWGGPCVRTDRGGMQKLDPAGPPPGPGEDEEGEEGSWTCGTDSWVSG